MTPSADDDTHAPRQGLAPARTRAKVRDTGCLAGHACTREASAWVAQDGYAVSSACAAAARVEALQERVEHEHATGMAC